jgi:hypothetical protein
MFPLVALTGTVVVMLVALQLIGVAAIPLIVTLLAPCELPRFVPVIVMEVPNDPDVGETLVRVGAETIVNRTPFVATPFTPTTTFPVVAPAGTGTVMLEALQLVGVAATPLKLTVPEEELWDGPKVFPFIVTVAPIGALLGTIFRIPADGRTTKFTPTLGNPPAVTTMFPVEAPVGTETVISVELQAVGVAATPLNLTVLVPWVDPNVAPLIWIDVPTTPDTCDKPEIEGATPNEAPLPVEPKTPTTIFPVVAPAGTGTVMLVLLQLIGDAATPLNVTMPTTELCEAPKLVPLIVTSVPTGPLPGDTPEITGVGRTTNGAALLEIPPTVTTTFPLDAPIGTGTVIDVRPHAVGAAVTPLKVTVLAPWVARKSCPAMVTGLPMMPVLGVSEAIEGAGTVTVVEPQIDPVQAEIVVEPEANAKALPKSVESFVTVAMELLEEVQLADARFCVELSAKVPVATSICAPGT